MHVTQSPAIYPAFVPAPVAGTSGERWPPRSRQRPRRAPSASSSSKPTVSAAHFCRPGSRRHFRRVAVCCFRLLVSLIRICAPWPLPPLPCRPPCPLRVLPAPSSSSSSSAAASAAAATRRPLPQSVFSDSGFSRQKNHFPSPDHAHVVRLLLLLLGYAGALAEGEEADGESAKRKREREREERGEASVGGTRGMAWGRRAAFVECGSVTNHAHVVRMLLLLEQWDRAREGRGLGEVSRGTG